jgi:hypothetical protein
VRFRTTIQLEGKTATGFRVPPEIVAELGQGKKRPAVVVTINGHAYRSTIAAYGELFMLPLAAEHRLAAGVNAGQEIDVELILDTAPREVEVPPDLAAALAAEPTAKAAFVVLSYSHKRRHVLAIEEARTPQTRSRRIEKAIAVLRDG